MVAVDRAVANCPQYEQATLVATVFADFRGRGGASDMSTSDKLAAIDRESTAITSNGSTLGASGVE